MKRWALALEGLVLSATVTLGACAPAAPPVTAPVAVQLAPSAPTEAPVVRSDPRRFHALLLNGGGETSINYQSHLAALTALRRVLLDAGVLPAQLDILSGDGEDPAVDQAQRSAPSGPFPWLLDGTRLERALGAPMSYVSSAIPGVRLGAATKASLAGWFEWRGSQLVAGDTLFLFVTDHGTKGPTGPSSNAITLWGAGQSITVDELSKLLATLAPGVRVVTLMSQCFSGGFAGLSALNEAPGPHPTVCGYFSSTADRPAYGCYPENLGDDSVGHAHDFARALAATHHLPAAHGAVFRGDTTPDVPLRSSELRLESVVRAFAAQRSLPPWTTVAQLLGSGWREEPSLRAEVAELDALAAGFGLPAPRSVDELLALDARVARQERETAAAAKAWANAFGDATNANLSAFSSAHPDWAPRITDAALLPLGAPERGALAATLKAELGAFAQGRGSERLFRFHERAEASAEVAYRMAVRRAVLLRLNARLTTMAGRALLATGAAESDRQAYEALVACEDLTLPGAPRSDSEASAPRSDGPAPLSALEVDETLARSLRPSWLGIAFADAPSTVQKRLGLSAGAVLVTGLTPGSPAKEAGLEVGDLVLGTGGAPFDERRGLRAWTMLQPAGVAAPLDILRGTDRRTVSITPRLLPEGGPPPAAPVAVALGASVPPFDFQAYRGTITPGKPHLFYFWATWCKPCKAALPELLAYERATKTQIVAVTDEDPAVLDAFFKTFGQPFPKVVVRDEMRRSFVSLGAAGTPTFVLVDDKGVVRSRRVGYTKGRGLVDGWSWDGK